MIRQGNRLYDPETGSYYRLRRGELKLIPIEWVNKVTTPATIKKRDSKLPPGTRKALAHNVRANKKATQNIDLNNIDEEE